MNISEVLKNKITKNNFEGDSEIKLISNRTGKKIFIINSSKKESLVAKIFDLNYEPEKYSGPMISPKELFEQEVKMLKATLSINGQYIDSFILNGKAVILIKRAEGKPARVYIEENPTEAERVVGQMISRVSELHKAKILHGDLQSAHFFATDTSVELIDYGMSGFLPSGYEKYQGALIHYVSPGVAKQMAGEPKTISYSQESEMYSLGATILYCLTRKLPTNYGVENFKDISFNEKRRLIAENGPDQYWGSLREEIPGFAVKILDYFLQKDALIKTASFGFN